MPPPPDRPDPDTVRCPTCRAIQPWSDSCRRCQGDLRMLRDVASAYHRRRRRCLAHLRAGDPAAARAAARSCHALAPSDESRRLLAVASLLLGDPATAVWIARQPSRPD